MINHDRDQIVTWLKCMGSDLMNEDPSDARLLSLREAMASVLDQGFDRAHLIECLVSLSCGFAGGALSGVADAIRDGKHVPS